MNAYGIDTSSSGHVGWCKCGWRTDVELDAADAGHAVMLHRTRTHDEPRRRVERVLGMHLDDSGFEVTDEVPKPKRQKQVSQANVEFGARVRHLARLMEAGQL